MIYLRLHCGLVDWVLGVQVAQELIQGLSTMQPGGKDIIYVPDVFLVMSVTYTS